ncbi:unnamed protein product [Urochloa humidicola]
MESAGQAAAVVRVDGDHHLPDASQHAQVAADALRRELLKERIREEIFATVRRNLEPEVRRELRMEHAVPHHCVSAVRQADRRLAPKVSLHGMTGRQEKRMQCPAG